MPARSVYPCSYEKSAPAQHASVDCGLFVTGYAISQLRSQAFSFEQADMPVMRKELAEQLIILDNMSLARKVSLVAIMSTMLYVTGTRSTAEAYLKGDFSIMAAGSSVAVREGDMLSECCACLQCTVATLIFVIT